MTVVVGLPRLLPAFDVIHDRGGIVPMMAAHPQQYGADGSRRVHIQRSVEGSSRVESRHRHRDAQQRPADGRRRPCRTVWRRVPRLLETDTAVGESCCCSARG
jgi:hypothetical protein